MAKISGNKGLIEIFSDFFGQSPYPNYVKDTELRFLSVSAPFAAYFGIDDPNSLIGQKCSAIFDDPELCNMYEQFDREIVEGTDTVDRVLPSIVDENGVQHYAHVSKSLIKDEDGKIVGILGNLFDYTMTYEAKKRFDKQAEKYLMLPNKASCCAFIDVNDWVMLDFTTVIDDHLKHLDISIAEFLAKSDRAISSDSNAHKYFANFGKSEILKIFNSGDVIKSAEFIIEQENSNAPLWIKYEYIFNVNPENDHVCILLSVYDISAQRTEMDNLIKAAEQDSMTELLNHESAMSRMRSYISQEERNNLNAIFIIDIDNFKDINDTFGHRTGDTVIIEFAQRIAESFKETDIVGRIGGDEFVVLMKDIDSVWAATNKASELITTLQYECRREGRSIFLTSSIGVALFSDNVNLDDLYSEADEALYRAKNSGKNKYILSETGDFSAFDSSSKVGDIAVDLKTVLSGIDGVMFIVEVEDDDVKILYSSNSHYTQMIIEQMPADEYSRLLYSVKKAHELGIPLDYTSPKPQMYRNKIRWTHIKGNFLEPDRPNTIKLSLIVTDVFNFKNTQQKLEIENTKNNLALSISNILIWEYDISTRFITLHNSEEETSVPYWRNDMCFSQSKDDYIALYTKIDEGAQEGSAFIHFKDFFGYQTWMQVSFKTTYDDRGRISGALFAAVDVTNFMNIMDKYEALLARYEKLTNENKTGFHLNLTNNSVVSFNFADGLPRVPQNIKTADDFFKFITNITNCSEERREYLEAILTTKNAIDRLDIGTDMMDEELFCQLSSNDCEWFMLRMHLVTNPETNEKELIGYLRNVHAEKTSQMIIDNFIRFEYELLAVLDTAKETIKVIQENSPKYIGDTDTYNFESFLYEHLPDYIVENELQECAYAMDLHTIQKELATKKIYSISVSVYENIDGQVVVRRKKYQYTYNDDSRRYIAVTRSDITDQYKSEFDPVSGIYNRNAFYKKAKELIDSNPRTTFVIVRWDIDRFKIYNDTFGTEAGDELLAMIGNSYRDSVSDDMIVANLGADNFVICMPNNKFNPKEHSEYLTNLLSSISDRYTLTFHMSGYMVTDSSIDIGLMCDRAAIAIKSIKDQLSTRFVWYDDSMRDNAVREQELLDEIKLALENDEFCIYVQPQFNQISNKLVSGEVLVRWHKQDGTIVSPGVFVPLMEKSGLISRLDEIIWDKAAAFISERLHAGKPITPLAVNISRRDFYRPNFCKIFYDLIEKYDIESKYLDLEVTESAYIENNDLLINIINELRSNGFKFKMDDFGTGYSSLNTLKNVPVDMIKLDMKFIDLDANDDTANFRGGVILDSVLRMSHWLGIPVIAEGVETAQQAEFLKSIDCAIIQGYYFSEPLNLADFSALLERSLQDDNFAVLNANSSFDNYDFWNPTSYSAILFNSFIGPAGIFEYYNGNITPLRLNERFYEELGVDPAKFDYYNADFLELIHEDDRESFIEAVNIASQTSQEHSCEFKWYVVSSDKKEHYWVRLRIRRIAHNNKRFVFFVGVDNTTVRKKLELRNSDLAERLGNFIDIIPGGVLSFKIDNKIDITYISPKLYSIFGYDKNNEDDVKKFKPIMDIHPDDRDSVFDAIWSDAYGAETRTLRVRHICKNGDNKWVFIKIIKTTIDADGSTMGYCIVNEDYENTQTFEDMYGIEAIAKHSDRLISRLDIKTGRLIHYFDFAEHFDVPSGIALDTLQAVENYNVIKADVDFASFYNTIKQGDYMDKVIVQIREKNSEYAPYYCRTSIIKDASDEPLFAIMSLQKKLD